MIYIEKYIDNIIYIEKNTTDKEFTDNCYH